MPEALTSILDWDFLGSTQPAPLFVFEKRGYFFYVAI
jgi:hypothetical protein